MLEKTPKQHKGKTFKHGISGTMNSAPQPSAEAQLADTAGRRPPLEL